MPPTSGEGKGRRALRIIVTVLVVGGGIGLVSTLHRIDWAAFGSAFARVSSVPFVLALCVSTVQVFAQLARFAVILPREERAPLRDLLEVTAVGQLLNYTTALRAGDAYKLARLSSKAEHTKRRFARLAAALVLERIADVVTLLVVAAATTGSWMVAWTVSRMPTPATALRAAVATGVGAIVVSLVVRRAPLFLRFAHDAWKAMASPGFARCLIVALVAWVLDAGTLYWTSRSAGCAIAFRTAVPCVFLLNVGIAIPVTVGNIGIFEASLAFALSRYGVLPERALVIATLEHVEKLAGLVLCVALLRLVPRGRP
jgi:uncharacterized membrane protein YbhN (UPF0104 family)